jgi:hypothetical protein
MHNAPSVIYPLGRCRLVIVLLLLLAFAALLLLVLWWTTMIEPTSTPWWTGWAGALLWLGWGLWAVRHWRRSPRGWLEWDAHATAACLDSTNRQGAWRWRDAMDKEATSLNSVELAVDLQILVLLCLRGSGRVPRWAWMERWRCPARWNDLRRALHSQDA